MRVRIRQLPTGVNWAVDVKPNWFLGWQEVERFGGDKAEAMALEFARRLKNPRTFEIKDTEHLV